MKKITQSREFKSLENKAYKYKWNNRDWSDWGLLFRFLIIICRILEGGKKHRQKRKPSAWSIFLGEQLRAGKTIQQAAKLWKQKKPN